MSTVSGSALREWALAVHLARWQPEAGDAATAVGLIAEGVDWGTFCEIAFAHQVYPLVAYNVERLGLPVPRDVRARLRAAWLLNRGRATRLEEALLELASRLERNGIGYRVFKGPDFGRRLYGDPALRHADDLDLLVGEADGNAVAALLQEAGFRLVERSRYSQSFAGMLGGYPVAVDVHHGLVPCYLDVGDRRLVADLLAGRGTAADPVLEAIALTVHLGRHRELLLKWVVDLDALLRSVGSTDFTEMLAQVAAAYRARRFVEAALTVTRALFGGDDGEQVGNGVVDDGWLWFVPFVTPPQRAWRPYLGKFALVQSRWRMMMWLLRYPFLPPPDRDRGTVLGDLAYRLRRERGRFARKRGLSVDSGQMGAKRRPVEEAATR